MALSSMEKEKSKEMYKPRIKKWVFLYDMKKVKTGYVHFYTIFINLTSLIQKYVYFTGEIWSPSKSIHSTNIYRARHHKTVKQNKIPALKELVF